MTFILTDHKINFTSMLYYLRSVPLGTSINKPGSEISIFRTKKAGPLNFNVFNFKSKYWHMCIKNLIRLSLKK